METKYRVPRKVSLREMKLFRLCYLPLYRQSVFINGIANK